MNNLIIHQNVTLKDKNWFRTGGNAKLFCEPDSFESFSSALRFANNEKLEIFILGEGANILISDQGFDGLIIRPKLKEIQREELNNDNILVTAGSGVSFRDLINWCLEKNIVGLEEFSGIPGTVGGSVYINIHYYEFLLSHFLTHAQVINKKNGELVDVDNEWFNFGYNNSKLHDNDYFLINATFKLKKADDLNTQYARGRSFEIIRHRTRRYPNQGTCGSFFRNFFQHEVVNQKNPIIYVAYYLDKIGIKGSLNVGDACVSYQHANMLVNKSNASSNDIIKLALKMQELVRDHFNIIPQTECRLIGFKKYPLLS